MKRKLAVTTAVAVVALASGGWLLQRQGAPEASVYQQARLFEDVLDHVADDYVDSIDTGKLYQMAIDGMLDQLHDPYSVFLKRDDFRALNEQISGDYGGFGFQFDIVGGWVTVIAPLPDTPAERAGLQTGDVITAVDGQSTQGWNNDQALKNMRGQAGTSATLTVKRTGVDRPMPMKITRANIHVNSVLAAVMLDDRVGYVQTSVVSRSLASDLANAIAELQKQGMKSLILDLRGNPGGSLEEGIAASDLFLDPGQEVVQTRGRMPGSTNDYKDGRPQQWPSLPIVILTNGGTASAAEIITGALQDHDRAVVVGTPTFGKGLVQSVWPLTSETALKLTTGRWYTPSGRTIQRVAKNEAEHEAQVMATDLGKDTVKLDSSLIFHTDHGRVVYGGGGIRPDIYITPDTFTTAERNFNKALGSSFPVFRDVLSTYSLELRDQKLIPNPNFTVTSGMVDEVLRRLKGRNVVLADSLIAGARNLIGQDLADDIEIYSFGRAAEVKRRVGEDRQVQKALDLAHRARSPQDLLSLATTAPGANRN
ncbi:MAG TPA: S41 family peptidase [Gemmatimonadales bacterium]|nr:S41 family peptidase [Gemmatimonadales bacterium]